MFYWIFLNEDKTDKIPMSEIIIIIIMKKKFYFYFYFTSLTSIETLEESRDSPSAKILRLFNINKQGKNKYKIEYL